MSAKSTLNFLVPRIGCVVFILLLLEVAFRMGVWEPFAKPDSNAGIAIRVKQSVKALGPEKIDFVTIGDSRAVYGIDHERVATLAKSNGLTHINASMPGTHWMSTELMIRWLQAQAPNLKGAIIATNVASFSYNGNGFYELGIATPLASVSDVNWMSLHVPFEQKNLATYGSYLALFQYREDIADLLKNPVARIKNVASSRQQLTGGAPLFQSQKVQANICATPTSSIKTCAAAPVSEANSALIASCKSFVSVSENQVDFREFNNANKWPHLAEVKRIRQKQLSSLGMSKPPLVVLMPIPKVWREELLPKGGEEWTLSILRPLAEQGVIELLDYTQFFDSPYGSDCAAFWDLYHQNADGQQKLTDSLLPQIEKYLYKANPTKL
jgi:hypothetical protein